MRQQGKARQIIFLLISLGQQPQNPCALVNIVYISNSHVLIMVGLKKFRYVNKDSLEQSDTSNSLGTSGRFFSNFVYI